MRQTISLSLAAFACGLAVLLPACGDGSPVTTAPEAGDRPVLAGPPIFVNLDDPEIEAEESAFFTEFCGFPVTVDLEGGFQILLVSASPRAKRQTVELHNFRLRYTFTNAAGESTKETVAGPDRFYIQDGQLFLAITGRSIGGIGLFVINLETGEVVKIAGRDPGIDATVCDPLS